MTDYYVATTGNDSNPGTSASPFLTIGHAAGIVNAGDTVHVSPGTYNETLALNRGGTSGNPVTFISDGRHAAIVISPSAVAAGVSFSAPYIIVDGFDLQAPNYSDGVFFFNGSTGSILRHNAIHNCAPGPTWNGGSAVGSPQTFSGTITIDGNWIYDVGVGWGGTAHPGHNHGMYLKSALVSGAGRVINNIVFGIPWGSGIQLYPSPQGWDVANNTVFNCFECGITVGSEVGLTMSNDRVLNNIAYACYIAMRTQVGGSIGTGVMFENNLDYLCTFNATALMDPAATLLNNITDTDPKFVNYQANGSGDYHLQAISPCINAGTSLAAPTTDFDGTLRPRGGLYDIGAYEYPYTLYSEYKNIIEPNLIAALSVKNLLSAVQLIGPDTTSANDSWLTPASTDLSSTLSGYVRHAFPAGATDISSGGREVAVKSLVSSIVANGPGKPIIQGEMADGALGPGQSVALYQYGVEMADFAIQLARAGMTALIAYLLDDDMHGTQWGMWQITQDTGQPRPWFFIWSLLTRMLVPGSTLYAPAQPSSNDLRVLVAQSPQGAWTFVLVNRKATAQNIQVVVPFAPVVSTTMQSYIYSSAAPLLVDTNGFPLPSGSISAVLSRGFTVTLAANSVLILSQQTATTTNLYDVKRPPLQKRR